MKPPKRISELLLQKEIFLLDMRTKLQGTVLKLQSNLFETLIEEIIPQIETRDGVIIESARNYELVSRLNKVYDTFDAKVASTILPMLNKNLDIIKTASEGYFSMLLGDELPKRFDKIIKATQLITDLKIGLRSGKMIRGGVIMNMLESDRATLQQQMSKAISSKMNMRDFIKVIKENVKGTDVKSGSLDRQFKMFAYDTYRQYDSAYSKNLAEEFGFKYFVYNGVLIDDSRDFCVCHNGKVFSVDEAQTWKDWVPDDCEFPVGYKIRQKDTSVHPGYMNVPGYDPLVDLGGYNCQHHLGYITDSMAFKMRPDLRDK